MPKKKGKQVNAAQQEKLEQKKLKKELARIGEDDIETILTQFKKADAAKVAVSEVECARPSPRINATLCAHPTKDALILFGGELFNGEKCWVYNDLFFFGTAKHEWRKISSPNTPPPRCAHQAVTLSRQGGQMWIFGGEFTSQTQTQFYHHKDLWVLNLTTNAWEQVDVKNGPTPRSGHRMVAWKNKLVIFGGYFDNGRSVPKYMNELWLFDVESYKWQRVDFKEFEPQPNPRSGCQLMVHGDQVLLYGGYARTEVGGAGTVFDDLWSLNMTSLKWLKLKKAGVAPNPRTGQPWVPVERKKGAIMFGGVFDREETDEDIISTFCNDMFLFEYETKKFATFKLRRKRKSKVEKTLDKVAAEAAEAAKADEESDESDYDEGCPTGVAKVEEFEAVDPLAKKKEEDAFFNTPGERSHCLLAVKGTMLYLYGGVREEGEREITLNDMHCLDTKSFDKWQLVQASDTVEWVGEEDDDDDEDGEEGDEDDSDSDEDDEDDEDDAPPKKGAAKAAAKGKAEKSGKAEKVDAKAAARKKGQDAPAAKSKKPAPAAAAPAPKMTAEQKAARKEEEKAARLASRLEKQAKIDEDAKEVNPFAAGTLRAEPHTKGADAGSESDE